MKFQFPHSSIQTITSGGEASMERALNHNGGNLQINNGTLGEHRLQRRGLLVICRRLRKIN